jgi:hypothetical protein
MSILAHGTMEPKSILLAETTVWFAKNQKRGRDQPKKIISMRFYCYSFQELVFRGKIQTSGKADSNKAGQCYSFSQSNAAQSNKCGLA